MRTIFANSLDITFAAVDEPDDSYVIDPTQRPPSMSFELHQPNVSPLWVDVFFGRWYWGRYPASDIIDAINDRHGHTDADPQNEGYGPWP